jgi:hypothetical protein
MDDDPSRHPRKVPTAAPADDREDISVRGYLRHLRWIAPGLLLCCLAVWALGRPPGMSLPWALFLWAILTVATGPLLWLWLGVRRGTPGWWRALGLAIVWSLGALALLGVGYALVVAVRNVG